MPIVIGSFSDVPTTAATIGVIGCFVIFALVGCGVGYLMSRSEV